jgi:hypothetical protein
MKGWDVIKLKFSKEKKLKVTIDIPNNVGVHVTGVGETEEQCYQDAVKKLYEIRQNIDAAIDQVKKTFNPDHCGLSHHITCTCKGEGGDR